MDIANIEDPTMEYCKVMAGVVNKTIGELTRFWYKIFRAFGHTASDAFVLAKDATQEQINKIDFTVNFDGPMV